jgi:Na+-transporting methylmalonyl-CoA/oxaloacetate decarboxylase gamma subunit
MDLSDALTITGLGMAVVFSGLLLTAGLIVAFGRLQQLLDGASDAAKRPIPAIEPPSGPGPVINAEILTVITTVLEVERRLHRVRVRENREIADE